MVITTKKIYLNINAIWLETMSGLVQLHEAKKKNLYRET